MQAAPSPTRVPVQGGDLLCETAGPRDSVRPALLFLHGWTLDHRMWAPQLRALCVDRLCVAPDRRGFGRSNAPAAVAMEHEDIAHILDALGVARAIVVGMSQGGRPALEFALAQPERTAALVLQGARFGAADTRPEIPVDDYIALIRAGRLDAMKALWRAHAMMQTTSAEARATAEAILADYDGRDLLAAPAAAAQLDAAAVAGIEAPALIVTGAHDTPGRHVAAAALAAALPNAQKIEIADAGHLCNLDQPEAYNAVLTDFLVRIGA
ncbi:MAG: alpha/beta fold hydrolase [Hyphomonadaceae bacterium]